MITPCFHTWNLIYREHVGQYLPTGLSRQYRISFKIVIGSSPSLAEVIDRRRMDSYFRQYSARGEDE